MGDYNGKLFPSLDSEANTNCVFLIVACRLMSAIRRQSGWLL